MIVIYNPTAGQRRVHRVWDVLDILTGSGVRVRLMQTAYAGHGRLLAAQAAAAGERLVVAAGGDGTIAEVAAGLAGAGTAMGVIPIGTANVLAQELGLPMQPRDIAAALAFRRTRSVWPGVATGHSGTRLFVQMLGMGLDAQVVHRMPLPMKRLLGRSAYVAQTFREMLRYDYRPIHVRLDGERHEAGSLIVSKGRFYGGHFMLAPDACPAEPGFSVALFNAEGPGAALVYGAALPLNLLPHVRGVRLMRASRVDILDSGPVQADGDPAGEAPLSVCDAAAPIDIVTA